jgi:hypothetical protein
MPLGSMGLMKEPYRLTSEENITRMYAGDIVLR